MSVFQFRKTPLHRQRIPSRILAISPAIRDSTKVQNAVSTTSAESLAFFSSCASACARVSRWRSYSIVHGWRICLAGLPQFFNFRRSFSFSISASLSGATILWRRQSRKAPHYPCHRLAERAFPVSCQFWMVPDTRTENVSQLLLLTSIVSFHGQNREKRQRPKARFQHLSFPFFSEVF